MKVLQRSGGATRPCPQATGPVLKSAADCDGYYARLVGFLVARSCSPWPMLESLFAPIPGACAVCSSSQQSSMQWAMRPFLRRLWMPLECEIERHHEAPGEATAREETNTRRDHPTRSHIKEGRRTMRHRGRPQRARRATQGVMNTPSEATPRRGEAPRGTVGGHHEGGGRHEEEHPKRRHVKEEGTIRHQGRTQRARRATRGEITPSKATLRRGEATLLGMCIWVTGVLKLWAQRPTATNWYVDSLLSACVLSCLPGAKSSVKRQN